LLLGSLLLVAASRSPYLLLHGRFWAEEGSIYFVHMKHEGFWYVARPVGYFYAFANIAAWLAARVPLEDAPLVTAWLSLAVIAALVWASLWLPSELLPNAGAKTTAAVLLVVGPLAIPVVWLNATNVQTYLGILAILFLFVDVDAVARGTFLVIVVLLGLAGLSGLYAAALAPLFIFNAVRDPTRRRIVLAALIAVCAVLQLIVVQISRASGDLAQGRLSFHGFGSIARDLSASHFGTFVFGVSLANRIHGNSRVYTVAGLVALSLFGLLLGTLLLSILAVVPSARVAGLLVLAFALEETLVVFGSRRSPTGRYAVVPIAILVLIAIHGLTAGRWASRLSATLCLAALIAGCSVFWTANPSVLRCVNCPEWSQQVDAWRAGGPNVLVIWPYQQRKWRIRLPRGAPASARPAGSRAATGDRLVEQLPPELDEG
jgi:hypothetical protein